MDYRTHNRENEWEYHYAPFSLQRRELRKEWSSKPNAGDWEEYLYRQELRARAQFAF